MKNLLALLFALLASPATAQVIPSGPWGSINYWGVGGASQVLNPGLAGQCLETQGTGSAPVWVACPGSALNLLPSINTNTFLGNVSGNYQAPTNVDVNTILNTVGYDIARPPPVEAILYKSNVGPTFNWQALPPGVTGALLTSGGPTNPPFWSPTATQANLASICQIVGAVLYFDTPSNLWKCLAPGTSGQLLQTGGVGANPSWLTLTLAALGGVPTTRNVNTTAPLGGGGALSSDLTLTCSTCATTTNGGALSATSPVTISAAGVVACATCATTTNGGALSATSPVTISAAGVVACATCATTTNGGALSATAPIAISAAGVISITSPLPIANGGTNAATQTAAFNNLAPTATRAGDITYWNGSNYVNLAGNNSGTQILTENSSGVPTWAASGSVSSVTCGTGLSGGTITTSGTCAVSLTTATNSLGADVLLNNTANYFDGPSVAQGTSGTWFASGNVLVTDSSNAANINCKLWDGTTVISSGEVNPNAAVRLMISLSGILASPAANIRISCQDVSATTGKIIFNSSGNSKDSTLTAVRIQ